ncbi:MAG: hypothetical protein LBQ31_07725 [Bacteroidales bacterium]|jgi:hypothetical protein|nr:hypothetical protein [Bacteroidales bacterium]
MKMTKLFTALLAIFAVQILNAQDVEQLIKAPWLTITGGFQTSGSAYSGFNMEGRRDPFGYQISANINFNIKGVLDIPFSMYLSSKNKTFNAPAFNIAGISPRYKWITLHMGVRAMDFSQYTYSGTNFTGGGIELMPEKSYVRGKAFYGLLNKKILAGDTSSPVVVTPAYSRYGGGAMVNLGTQENNVDVIVFAAADRKKSLRLDSNIIVVPKDNIVVGLNTKQKIGEMFLISASYGFSSFSLNSNLSKGMFEKNMSRIFSHAIDLTTDVKTKWFSVGVSARYIDPNYQTMGALYMTNDVADITLNAASAFWQNKINVSGSFGFQRNNVKKQLSSTDKNIIGNINIAASEIVKNLGLSFSYSNYNTSAEAVQVIINDSIKYAQINNNLSFNVSYSFGGRASKDRALRHSLSLSAMMQGVQTLNNEFSGLSNQTNNISNVSVSYGVGVSSIGLNGSINGSIGSSQNSGGSKNLTSNIGATLSKSFFRKTLQTSFGYTAGMSGKNTSNNFRFTTGCVLKKAHRFSLSMGYLARNIVSDGDKKKTGEFTATLSYGYNFNLDVVNSIKSIKRK